jgi:phenylalanyl-tRNA synthetase alpha chain
MSSPADIFARIDQTQREFESAVVAHQGSSDEKSVEALRVQFLGRKGALSEVMELLRSVPVEDKPRAGKLVNDLRQHIEGKIEHLKQQAQQAQLDRKLVEDAVDISLPNSSDALRGSLHPVSLMRQSIMREFRRLGFTVYDGPEVDADFYNFSALNFPDHHPARDMHDTFFVNATKPTVLRTHTSNIQIHAMLDQRPPLRIVAPGRTFRCDSDLTHTPMFHQVEAFVVDRNISFAHMKGTIEFFLKGVYGPSARTRFRPSYFPFVEPGAEIDMACTACAGKGCRICKETGWLEIGGCGMIHPNVFEAVEYDSETYTGFAFGFGIDRMAMLKYNLPDLRQLFEGDEAFLSQFPIHF